MHLESIVLKSGRLSPFMAWRLSSIEKSPRQRTGFCSWAIRSMSLLIWPMVRITTSWTSHVQTQGPKYIVAKFGYFQSRFLISRLPWNWIAGCPKELQLVDGVDAADVVACRSACDAFGLDQYCCSGQFANPNTCRPSMYSTIFKRACPKAYSYAFDDGTSTFTCKGIEYTITFCPTISIWDVASHTSQNVKLLLIKTTHWGECIIVMGIYE